MAIDFINTILQGRAQVGDVIDGYRITSINHGSKAFTFEKVKTLEDRMTEMEATHGTGGTATPLATRAEIFSLTATTDAKAAPAETMRLHCLNGDAHMTAAERQDWSGAAAKASINDAVLNGTVIPTGPNAGQRDTTLALVPRVVALESIPANVGLIWRQTAGEPLGAQLWRSSVSGPRTFSCDIQDPEDANVTYQYSVTDIPPIVNGAWVNGWTHDGFYGCPAKHENITLSNGRALHVVVGLRLDNSVMIAGGKVSGSFISPWFKVRNIKINGLDPVDNTVAKKADLDAAKARGNFSTTETDTGNLWTDGKTIYRRVFTGTLPTGLADTMLFTVPGATEIIETRGRVKLTGYDRTIDLHQLPSGAPTHGPAIQMYLVNSVWEMHSYASGSPDARFRGPATYTAIVQYTK
jgi:hypothetical protein